MSTQNNLSDFRFQRLRLPMKIIAVLPVVIFMALLWWLLNPITYFWFSLAIAAILAWIASFGWRQALINVIYFLNRLMKL